MPRSYTLGRRAETQAATRLRIVEAAVELHSSIGPALTSISMVAERAGVQRHTFYAHFPDERSLFLACSGLAMERDPLPNAQEWHNIKHRGERLRTGLLALYQWYERNAQLAACVLRDAEYHPLTKDIAAQTMGPPMKACADVLGVKMSAKQRAVLALALSYYTWRSLVLDGGLKSEAAIEVMIGAIDTGK